MLQNVESLGVQSSACLKDEKKHVDWLEAQVHQMKEIGHERYPSQQIRKEK